MSFTPNQPRFDHDCPHCVYLGQTDSSAVFEAGDVYVCTHGFRPMIVVRHSDVDSDNSSGRYMIGYLLSDLRATAGSMIRHAMRARRREEMPERRTYRRRIRQMSMETMWAKLRTHELVDRI
jgi:hypothetical protein